MGASISGAGPSVFAWFESRAQAALAAPAIQAAFAEAGFESQAWVSPIAAASARLL
jgi:homoserine kinase